MVVRVGVRHAPVQVVVARGPIHGLFALVAVALAITAAHLSATVVVRDDVVALIGGIVTGADPGNRRRCRAGGAGVRGAAAAGAKKSVDGAVLPIVAAIRIIRCRFFLSLLSRGRPGRLRAQSTVDGQQRNERRTREYFSERGAHSAAAHRPFLS